MKIKSVMIALFLLVFVGIFPICSGLAIAQNDMVDMVDPVRMDTSAFDRLRRPAAIFDHDEHNEAAQIDDCAVCHHVWENGKLVPDESSEDMTCSECHGVVAGPDNPMPLVNAYHTQCKSCHRTQGKGPLLCAECHKKL